MKLTKTFLVITCIIILLVNVNALEVDFDNSTVFNANSNLIGKATSYTKISLELNGVSAGFQELIPNSTEYPLSKLQSSIGIARGTTLKILNDQTSPVKLTVRQGTSVLATFTVSPNDYFEYKFTKSGIYTLENENTLETYTISVSDSLKSFEFSGLNFRDGKNLVLFTLEDLGTGETKSFKYSITVNKYPVSIVISSYNKTLNILSKEEIVKGSVTSTNIDLYYVVNVKFSDIHNYGILKKIKLNGNKFTLKLDASNFEEGNNSILFVAVDKGLINLYPATVKGLTSINVTADYTKPSLLINDPRFRLKTNQPVLEFNVSTDGVMLNYTFNNRNYSEKVKNGVVTLRLSLVQGTNNLTLIAYDAAGNSNKVAHAIKFDNRPPEIVKLEPNDIFGKNEEAHLSIFEVSGKLNKKAHVIMFSIPGDKYSCSDFKNSFIRKLSNTDKSIYDSSMNLNPNSEQATVDLGVIFMKREFDTKSDGSFDKVVLGLPYKRIDYEVNGDSSKIKKVETVDKVCFIMEDEFGNVAVKSYSVKLDTGNTMWRAQAPKTYPNTVYSSEIEQGNAQTTYSNTEFGMIVRFVYTGQGKVTRVSGFVVNLDGSNYGENKMARIDNSRVHWFLDKESGELVAYIPVELTPLHKRPIDYPSKLSFRFAVHLTYSVDDSTIPIDIANPIYFKTDINVERPLDHSKWLTPKTIDKVVKELNSTIKTTQQLIQYSKWGSIGGIIGCMAAKGWYAYKASVGTVGPKDEKSVYRVCDRVYCLPSPPRCEDKYKDYSMDVTSRGPINKNKLNDMVISDNKGYRIGVENAVLTGESCILPDGSKGRYVDIKVKKNEKLAGIFGRSPVTAISEVSSTYDVRVCKEVNKNQATLNLAKDFGFCYNPEPPYFDGTKCWLPFVDGDNGPANWNPHDNIIESIRCGCLPDTYSHLNKWLAIQESLRGCLQQAKIGEVQGSYCERLLSQAVCDVAINLIFKPFMKWQEGSAVHERKSILNTDFTKYFSDIERKTKERYRNNELAKRALQTDQLAHKMCVAAVSGDWSILGESLLQDLKSNQVEPTFGPPIPESRIVGYDPITGTLTIEYRFTHAILSGGQDISVKYSLYCDKSRDYGEFCPNSYGQISMKEIRRFVPQGGSAQETIVVKDTGAKYWANVLHVEYDYMLNGKKKHVVKEYSIIHKGEVPYECSFHVSMDGKGDGFECQHMFGDQSLISAYKIEPDSKFVPTPRGTTIPTYYPGNSVYLLTHYLSMSANREGGLSGSGSFNALVSMQCKDKNGNKATMYKTVTIGLETDNPGEGYALTKVMDGNEVVFGKENNAKYVYTATISKEGKYELHYEKGKETNAPNSIEIDYNGNSYYISAGDDCLKVNGKCVMFNLSQGNIKIETNLNANSGTLYFKSNATKIQLAYLGVYNVNSPSQITLQPGICSVKVMPLPPDVVATDTEAAKQILNSSKYQSNVNLAPFETRVQFAEPPKQEVFTWEIVLPRENQYICTNENRGGPTLKIVAISSKNSYNNKIMKITSLKVLPNQYSKGWTLTKEMLIKINGEETKVNLGDIELTDGKEKETISDIISNIEKGDKTEVDITVTYLQKNGREQKQTLKFYLMKCEENYKEETKIDNSKKTMG